MLAEVGHDELYRREPALGPGATERSRSPTRGSSARSRPPLRSRPRRCREAAHSPSAPGDRDRAQGPLQRSRPRAARSTPTTWSTPQGSTATRSTRCSATTIHRAAAARRADRLRQARPGTASTTCSSRCRRRRRRACWSRPPSTATCCSDRPPTTSRARTTARPPPKAWPRCSDDGERIMPRLLEHEVTATYVGLRAATEDRRLPASHPRRAALRLRGRHSLHRRHRLDGDRRSTSARASPTPALTLAERPRGRRCGCRTSASFRPASLRASRADRARPGLRPHRLLLRAGDPRRDRAAIAGPIPPADLDGLRRRTRVLMGRCQGFFCAAEVRGDPRARMAIESDGVVIVGGGPSGLAAAIELRRARRRARDRDRARAEAGGIPRHSDHTGFGFARPAAGHAGPALRAPLPRARGRTRGRARHRDDGHRLGRGGAFGSPVPRGRAELEPAAVVLATGCRERPRSARLVPGSRPCGVMTTSTLQQLVHLQGQRVGRRAVVVGAEHVSFSAVATLAHGGASVAAPGHRAAAHQSLAAFRLGAAIRYRAPVLHADGGERDPRRPTGSRRSSSPTSTRGRRRTVACDLVVFTADWIPDHELAVMAGCELDPGTRGPLVRPGASHQGPRRVRRRQPPPSRRDRRRLGARRRHVAAAVADHLDGGLRGLAVRTSRSRSARPCDGSRPISVAAAADAPPRDRFLLRSSAFLRAPRLEVRAGRRGPVGRPAARLVPGRSAHIPADWAKNVDPNRGKIAVAVRIGWRDERPPPARSRRGHDRSQGGAVRRAAAAGRRGPPRQGQPPPARRAGSSRTAKRCSTPSSRRSPSCSTDPPGEVVACGLDHQGESVLAWDAESGKPLSARSSSGRTSARRRSSTGSPTRRTRCRKLSGLPFDPYFSAAKLAWLLEHNDAVQKAREAGTLRMGTVDSFLCDRLGAGFATDASTASRTQLHTLGKPGFDPELCEIFGVPPEVLPEVRDTAGELATLSTRAGRSSSRCAARSSTSRPRSPAPPASCPAESRRPTAPASSSSPTSATRCPKPAGGLLPTVAWSIDGRGGVRARRRCVRRRGDARVDVQRARPGRGPAGARASSRARSATRPARACCPASPGSARPGGGPTPAR